MPNYSISPDWVSEVQTVVGGGTLPNGDDSSTIYQEASLATGPIISAYANTASGTTSTTQVVNLPTGIFAGNLIIIAFRANGTLASVPTNPNFTLMYWGDTRTSFYYRIADGTEGSTTTFTLPSAQPCSSVAYRITNWYGNSSGIAWAGSEITGTPTSTGPAPNLTDNFNSSYPTLWITASGIRNTGAALFTSFPPTYTESILRQQGQTQGEVAMVARPSLYLNYVNTEIPGNFTASAATNWSLITIAIRGGSRGNFESFQKILNAGVNGGQLFTNPVVSTYSLVYTATDAYFGGVLAPNGDTHFIPNGASVGQKVSAAGVVSTYSLVYTAGAGAYSGGVLAPNGDIHFIPFEADRGQKVSAAGVVSTYSLVYTASLAYSGGVLAPNGDIHFVPRNANRGQKVSAAGVVSTYSLVYTSLAGYVGGVLASNGDIHFVPNNANRGQKVSASGVVSTYSLVSTVANAYYGGVIAPNGDIHFIPGSAVVGQKISATGVVSTYSLVYTASAGYYGGVLSPNGDIHFVPWSANRGQKVSAAGVVSTYSLVYTALFANAGGVLTPNGDIHFVPSRANVGQKLILNCGVNFSKGICMHPYFNKL